MRLRQRAITTCLSACRNAGVLGLCLLAGCLFDTREARDPSTGSTWQSPTTPGIVFVNLKTGLEERTGVNYTKSLNDVFTFVPLPEDANNPTLAGKFDNWTASVEASVVDRITSESSSITVAFNNREQIRDQNPFADWRVDYELTTVSNSVPPDTVVYRGKAQLNMQQGQKGWQVVRWEDLERVPGFATWGFLRGSLRL